MAIKSMYKPQRPKILIMLNVAYFVVWELPKPHFQAKADKTERLLRFYVRMYNQEGGFAINVTKGDNPHHGS